MKSACEKNHPLSPLEFVQIILAGTLPFEYAVFMNIFIVSFIKKRTNLSIFLAFNSEYHY